MTRNEDIAHAIDLGVDAIGLIFYAKSSRYVSIEKAATLLRNIPPFVTVVAVLVNPEKNKVQQIVDELPVTHLQFHGEEPPEFCLSFGKPFIKALPAQSSLQIQEMTERYSNASAILLDTPSAEYGGTGECFNWQIIPKKRPMPYILAGGLNELNVLDAVKEAQPYAVDLCSSIESLPGIKDHIKMSNFVKVLWGI